jgi:Fe-S-cluster containining protein
VIPSPAGRSRHNPCSTCGLCCRNYIVTVCGYDAWLICTRQRLNPEQFLVAVPQNPPGRDGFQLEPNGAPYGLMLDKAGPLKHTQPCVFLLQLGGGRDRCGIYAERPVVCQSYPMAFRHRHVVQRNNVLCPPDAWPEEEVRRPEWREAVQRQRMHFEVYYQVVARWNARVNAAGAEKRFAGPTYVATGRGDWRATSAPGRRFALREYLDYLLNVYTRLAGLDAAVGEAELARVRDAWGIVPREGQPASSEPRPAPAGDEAAPLTADGERARLAALHIAPGAHPWLDYLRRARRVIDSFYPEIPPQPLSVLLLPEGGAADDEAPDPGGMAPPP